MKTETLLLPLACLAFLSGCVSTPTLEDDDGALLHAVAADDVDFVARRMRKVPPDFLFRRNPLLWDAVCHDATRVAEFLLRKGADKEQRIRINSDGDPGPRILDFYLSLRKNSNKEVNEKIVVLLQRDRPNTEQEDAFELLEETVVNTFYDLEESFRVSVSGLPSSADTDDLLEGLVRKGYLSRDRQDAKCHPVEIVFEKADENTYTVVVLKNKEVVLGWRGWEGKLEKRYGYWMWTEISYASS